MYSKTLLASWADMDFNSHMRNTAFLDKSADVRMMYFAENGFPASEFSRLRLGPVVMKDEVEYRKEVGLLQQLLCNRQPLVGSIGVQPTGAYVAGNSITEVPQFFLSCLGT